MASLNSASSSLLPLRTLLSSPSPAQNTSLSMLPHAALASPFRPNCSSIQRRARNRVSIEVTVRAMANDSNYSFRRRNSGEGNNEPRETILLPGCDYNHWLIVMEFPKDPAPTREQMIDTYLSTLSTVLGSMEEAKKNMYAFSTTTYTGFQCTVDEETSEKFKALPGVLWVLPDSYIDVKNKDYGGDKYINGEIIPCKYPAYQPKQRSGSRNESRRYERRRDGPPSERRKPSQGARQAGSTST